MAIKLEWNEDMLKGMLLGTALGVGIGVLTATLIARRIRLSAEPLPETGGGEPKEQQAVPFQATDTASQESGDPVAPDRSEPSDYSLEEG